MENTNTTAEVVSSDLVAQIFNDYNLTQTPAEVKKEDVKTDLEVIDNAQVLPTPPKQELPKEEEKPKVSSDYSKRLKSLIDDGFIDNFTITVDEEDVYLDQIADLTEEGYKQILEGWKEEKEKQKKEKYVSVDGLDETTKKLIEIRRSGGDIQELIRENVTAIDQLTQLKTNIDDEQVQINIVGHDLQQRGLKPKVIQAQIAALVEDGELENQANTILDQHLSIHNDAIEAKRIGQLESVEAEKQNIKELRKNLSSTYKEWNIPDNIQKQLVDNATKLDEDKISNTDKLYFEAVKDPKKFAELNYFLNNPDSFKKFISSKKVLEAKLEGKVKPLLTLNLNKTRAPKLSSSSLEEYTQEILNTNK
jgi:hypothetical protein